MRSFLTIIVAIGTLVACSSPSIEPASEDFQVAFEKMQQDQRFLEERTLPSFEATQEFADDSGAPVTHQQIRCSISGMHAGGWDVLPSTKDLADSDATYVIERRVDEQKITVVLGVREGVADARYFFQQHKGEWHLAGMEIYSAAPNGGPVPSLPCKPEA